VILAQNNNFQVIWFKFSEQKILRDQIYILISSVPGAFSPVLSDISQKSEDQFFDHADIFQKSRKVWKYILYICTFEHYVLLQWTKSLNQQVNCPELTEIRQNKIGQIGTYRFHALIYQSIQCLHQGPADRGFYVQWGMNSK